MGNKRHQIADESGTHTDRTRLPNACDRSGCFLQVRCQRKVDRILALKKFPEITSKIEINQKHLLCRSTFITGTQLQQKSGVDSLRM